jgi:GntR family transcriptional regulator
VKTTPHPLSSNVNRLAYDLEQLGEPKKGRLVRVVDRLGFREIAGDLRQKIKAGHYTAGSVLPPEPELAAEYGASRSLVNRAMQVLSAEGLIRPQRGRGTLVTWIPPIPHSAARYSQTARENNGAKGAFDAEIKARGLEPRHEITVEHAEPPTEVADALGLPFGEMNCLVRHRRLLASGIPVRLNASWFPLEIAKGTVLEQPGPVITGGVKSALADLGYTQVEATERIIPSRLPTVAEANALEISPERTVTDIFHVGRTAEGRAVEVTTTVTPAHYLVIESSFPLV